MPIDAQPADDVMHLHRFGEADRFPGKTLNPCAQRQAFPLDPLRVMLAWMMLIHIKMTRIGTPLIRKIACDPKGLHAVFSASERLPWDETCPVCGTAVSLLTTWRCVGCA
jgi:hypothetical protein